MVRKTLSQDDRIALVQKRGYSTHSTSDRQDLLGKAEQRSLADATEQRHEDVGKLWQEFLAVKGMQREASPQPDSAMFKDFVEYYASSRYGRIDELPTVHSIRNMWFRYDLDSFIETIVVYFGNRPKVDQDQIPDYFWPVTMKWKMRDLHKLFVDEESNNNGHGHGYKFWGVDKSIGTIGDREARPICLYRDKH